MGEGSGDEQAEIELIVEEHEDRVMEMTLDCLIDTIDHTVTTLKANKIQDLDLMEHLRLARKHTVRFRDRYFD